MVPFKIFFRYVSVKEKILIALGTISAIGCGGLLPSMSLIMGDITNSFDPDQRD